MTDYLTYTTTAIGSMKQTNLSEAVSTPIPVERNEEMSND